MTSMSLETLVSWYDAAESATVESRGLAERDQDYYDGKQFTAAEEAALKLRGQPPLVFNRIAPKVDFLVGKEMELRSDPKAYPRTPNEDKAAESVTDAIRFVCDENNWAYEKSQAFKSMLIPGACGGDVRVEVDGEKVRIIIEHVPWDRMFWDPRSRHEDFRDAKYLGTVLWMDLEDALANERWADKRKELEASHDDTSNLEDTYDDRPQFGIWADTDGGRKRVKVCQMYWHVGKRWYVATFTRGAFLEEPRESPTKDEHGNSVPCLIFQSTKVNRGNERYGTVRSLIAPQDEINKRRSKALHLMSMRQVIADKGAVESTVTARQELARPDGFIEVRPGMRFEVQQTGDMAMGQVNLYQDAKSEIDAIGANAALTGKDPRQQSGRALLARQEGGLTEMRYILDGLRFWSLRIYRHVWWAIRQYWTHELWIRVTDSDEHMRWVPMNRRVTRLEQLQKQGIDPYAHAMQQLGGMPPMGAGAMPGMPPGAPQGPMMGDMGGMMPPPHPAMVEAYLGEVVEIENHVAELDVDIVLDEGPDSATIQQEQFSEIAELAKAGVPIPPEALIEASGLRNKKRIIEAMKGGGATPEQQQQAQAAQQEQQQQMQTMAQLAQAAAALDLEETKAGIDKTKAETVAIGVKARVSMDDAARAHVQQTMDRIMPMQRPQGGPRSP